jgi:hypothetical protein
MLNIVVCAKAVPDPKEACNIKIDPHTKTLLRCDVPLVINPLDKNAIEAALQLKRNVWLWVRIRDFCSVIQPLAVRMRMPRLLALQKVLKRSVLMM